MWKYHVFLELSNKSWHNPHIEIIKKSVIQVAFYSSGNQLEWREVESGRLPTLRTQLRATLVDKILYITGGWDDALTSLTSVLSWDPVAESWQSAGDLAVARVQHAAVAIPTSNIESYC